MNLLKNFPKKSFLIFPCATVIIGAVVLFAVHAVTGLTTFEAEDSTGMISMIDKTASKGAYIEFRQTDSGGATAHDCIGMMQVTITAPASNFAGTVASSSENTCFFLKNGTYNFHDVRPKNGMKIVGESKDGVVVNGYGYENAISGNAVRVTIANFTIAHFDNNGGVPRLQAQGAIRGNSGIWNDGPGGHADGWTVESMILRDNLVSGVYIGRNFTVRNNLIYNNGVTGIGGDNFVGGLIENNVIYNSGINADTGAGENGGNMKFTRVNGNEAQLIIRGNEVYNSQYGIWCDVGCNDVVIENNNVHDNGNAGIICELSQNFIIRGNIVTRSSAWVSWASDYNHGAIMTGECWNVLIENNTVDTAKGAIVIRQSGRAVGNESPFIVNTTKGITVKNNTIKNSDSIGASHSAAGVGRMDYNTVRFTGNIYDNPSTMQFWWSGVQQNYTQWQAGGRQ